MSWPGLFYDGKSAARHEAQIEIESDRLSLVLDGDTRVNWPFANLHWAEKPGSGAIHLGLATNPDARLTIEDQNFTAAMRKAFPGIDRMTARHLGHRRSLVIIISSSIALASIIYAAATLLPRLITPLIPDSIQQSIGDAALSDIISLYGEVEKSKREFCEGAAGLAALDRLVDRLAKSENSTSFRVRVADLKMINALAVPGGRVLATRGMIEFVKSPEEFAGVIAHEMGHAIHRHPTKSVIRGIGLGATLDFLLGGGLASTTTSLLLHTNYSRDAEREADDTGFRLMQQAGMSTAGMVKLFERFEKELPSLPKALQAFSSHPRSADRAKRLAGQAKNTGGPAMPEADWQALRKICDQG